jgi:hypothetical protein
MTNSTHYGPSIYSLRFPIQTAQVFTPSGSLLEVILDKVLVKHCEYKL